ncbi:MAG: hypothetical protein QOI12_4316 [Alphaproteobacteria bacterium]|nr:hypothetical protein [Alphaproteobacteria bacterium]
MHLLARIAAALAATLMLLAPALWNGFPLLQFDTGGYFARWYEGTLEVSRSTVYALFLTALSRPDFWPAVLAQAAATVWIVTLVLRVHGFGQRTRVLIVTIAALTLLTALPWLASQLITDVFAGLAVLALYLLVARADALARWERLALFVFLGFAAATHNATLAVLAALIGAGVLVALFDPRVVSFRGLGRGALALVLGAALLVAANYAVARQLAWTPGGIALSFGRMLQDGIVKRFLVEHCPDARFKLCDHLAELPDDADVFFWGESLFDRLGRFRALDAEMRTIVLESLSAYPGLQLKAAVAATVKQVVRVATGYGLNTEVWHTYGMIENFAPAKLPAMKAARQQRGELGFTAINRVHVPLAWASMLLLLGVIALGIARARYADLGVLAAAVTLALLANAVVCGVLSSPHDRYGARLVWLASLVLLMVPWRAGKQEAAAQSGGISRRP